MNFLVSSKDVDSTAKVRAFESTDVAAQFNTYNLVACDQLPPSPPIAEAQTTYDSV